MDRFYRSGTICRALGIEAVTLRGWRNRGGLVTDGGGDAAAVYSWSDVLRIAVAQCLVDRFGLRLGDAAALVNYLRDAMSTVDPAGSGDPVLAIEDVPSRTARVVPRTSSDRRAGHRLVIDLASLARTLDGRLVAALMDRIEDVAAARILPGSPAHVPSSFPVGDRASGTG